MTSHFHPCHGFSGSRKNDNLLVLERIIWQSFSPLILSSSSTRWFPI
ncbi:rCG36918 [Rattus norvegicus]|uniref:RCG36918 n=1 Tax=Rattus norvegicus TaxID=10116 RepID=A6HU62_RAT|nr:rCG36918 [Rattus norvegicus]